MKYFIQIFHSNISFKYFIQNISFKIRLISRHIKKIVSQNGPKHKDLLLQFKFLKYKTVNCLLKHFYTKISIKIIIKF
jgi:hypothetical protein